MDSKSRHSDKEVKGIKLSGLNRSMAIITGIMVVCLFGATAYTALRFNEMDGSTSVYISIEKLADTVYEASDYLTMQARLFVETADTDYMYLYFDEANVTRRREKALEELRNYSTDSAGNVFLEAAIQESNNLMTQEIYAMKLVSTACDYDMSALPSEVQEMQLEAADAALEPEAMTEKARTMMYDEAYLHSKATIHEHLYYFTQEIFNAMERGLIGGKDNLSQAISVLWILLGVLVIINILIFAAIYVLVIKPIYRYLNSIKEQSLLEASGSYELKYLAQVYNDIHTAKEASTKKEAVFKHRSEHDLMTGLLNRTSAEERIRQLLTHSEWRGILILVDLDELKSINDIFGHKAGDRAIIGIAETLKTHFRESDIVARIGGDEFLVYLPNAAENKDVISLSLVSLRRKLQGISINVDKEWHIHCSMGCAVQTSETDTFEGLFKQADTALYHVKRCGKNSFAYYDTEMEQEDFQFREKQLHSLQGHKKLGVTELQYLLGAVTSFYQMVMSVNLSGNNYYLMEEVKEGIFAQVPVYGVLDTFIETAAKSVYPEDVTSFLDHLSRDALLRAYGCGEKNIHHFFRFRHQDAYQWVEAIVILDPDEYGDICDITLLRWADEYPAALKRMQKETEE